MVYSYLVLLVAVEVALVAVAAVIVVVIVVVDVSKDFYISSHIFSVFMNFFLVLFYFQASRLVL